MRRRFLFHAAVVLLVTSSCLEPTFDNQCSLEADCIVREVEDPCTTCLSPISAQEAERADAFIARTRENCDEVVPCSNPDLAAGAPLRVACDSGVCVIGFFN